ncbi:MAG: radical SAM/SPASM domain-containing protein [Candidatus Xenobia bacterium]
MYGSEQICFSTRKPRDSWLSVGPDGERPGPNKAVLEITRACNMRCLHCASAAGTVRPNELSTERMLTLIDELHELGVEDMVFSGGEPLVRKDWPVLAARVRGHGMSLGMVSNGTFALRHMHHIREYLTAYSMSLDGMEETHNHIRCSPTAFSDVFAAFDELAEHDVYRFAVTSISKLNLHQLEDMYRLLVEHDVVGWQVQLVFASGRMREREELICSPEDLYRITEFLARVRDESLLELHTGDNIGYYTALEDTVRGCTWRGCQAGLSLISIEADGNVKGCLCQEPELREGKKFVEGNVNHRPIADIWRDDSLFAYNRQFDLGQARGFCASCRHLKLCRCGCTAFAHYVSGTKYNNPYCLYRLMATT